MALSVRGSDFVPKNWEAAFYFCEALEQGFSGNLMIIL
ncbi:hypothetical protein GGR21_001703 [Dysgonomonas hofstadii]|uniref:Uncharacterized protein n=1 Tax=Dysgonomonas hofstadii TaxID=637886 RepID=A0A840CNZ0_9BACT|nr:hypothetical protein [Dysgonomonas hofstadii]